MRLRQSLTLLGAFCLVGSIALSAGADHPAGDLGRSSLWSDRLYELLNQSNRIHGFWVNSTDQLYYRGNSAQLNAMLAGLAALPDARLTVVLHVGTLNATSPWADTPKGRADWSVRVSPSNGFSGPAIDYRVDVHLAGDVTLPDLKVPASATVESAGEIETFIRQHRERSAEMPTAEQKEIPQ